MIVGETVDGIVEGIEMGIESGRGIVIEDVDRLSRSLLLSFASTGAWSSYRSARASLRASI
jgi:hypothetical protein